jgi:hypothetical protein
MKKLIFPAIDLSIILPSNKYISVITSNKYIFVIPSNRCISNIFSNRFISNIPSNKFISIIPSIIYILASLPYRVYLKVLYMSSASLSGPFKSIIYILYYISLLISAVTNASCLSSQIDAFVTNIIINKYISHFCSPLMVISSSTNVFVISSTDLY